VNLARSSRPPVLAGIATAAVAAACWVVLSVQSAQMNGMGALAALGAFIATWVVMMAAMMLPSVVPFVSGFVRSGPRDWPVVAAGLVVAYLAVWAVFGVVAYFALNAMPAIWMAQRVFVGAAIVVAGLYALTPLQRSCVARCRAMCHVETRRPARAAGLEYGINCVGCSAGVMSALLVVGMSSIVWMLAAGALVFIYKVPPLGARWQVAGALALVAVGLGVALLPMS
jgi:predicted metal-binding membrane protein